MLQKQGSWNSIHFSAERLFYLFFYEKMQATLKYACTSTKKMGWIAKMVRNKKVDDALEYLYHSPTKPAKILYKLIHSARANAKQTNTQSLYIQSIDVSRGPKLKRMRFVGRARIHRYQRYRTFVKVMLAIK